MKSFISNLFEPRAQLHMSLSDTVCKDSPFATAVQHTMRIIDDSRSEKNNINKTIAVSKKICQFRDLPLIGVYQKTEGSFVCRVGARKR